MFRKILDEKEQGFTLIEILVVILIIGILASIAIPTFLNQRKKANDIALVSDVANASKAIETYLTGGGTTLDVYEKAGNKTTIVFEGSDVNLYAAVTPRWNAIIPASKATMSSGSYIDMRVYPVLTTGWDTHEEGEYCLAGGHMNGGKYTYRGGNPLKYGEMLYYDVALGGIVDFSEIVNAVKTGKKTSCSGFAKTYITYGGV